MLESIGVNAGAGGRSRAVPAAREYPVSRILAGWEYMVFDILAGVVYSELSSLVLTPQLVTAAKFSPDASGVTTWGVVICTMRSISGSLVLLSDRRYTTIILHLSRGQ